MEIKSKFLFFTALIFYYAENSACNPVRSRNPVLMISLDGMQSAKFEQFLQENPNAAIHKLIKNGVKADYMSNSK